MLWLSSISLIVEPACIEGDIVVTISVRCMCIVHPSGFVRAIPSALILCMDFKIFLHSCSPLVVAMPFGTFVQLG